ncbi:hypothetical protein KK062_29000 [Fulvivirgaceae bacterium PWU5]|uniref:Uncharacterized protein n=1 Tax=Dawidia cretensis TaxID=2782350 RepID=A0AAP2GSZ5_9BACT|nr:hypothetical protein [Dawidia cretensis]MBT1712316.1 hypothetical protein [Dawidia cretensis]
MAIKYLYLDDNKFETVNGQVNALNSNRAELEVTHQQPVGDWERERDFFLNEFSKKFDGLIVDLRLDDEPNSQGRQSFYKGTSLAQELRTLSTEKKFNEVPIILLSASANILESLDNTGKDLFDIRIPKERLQGDEFKVIRARMVALGNGYKFLSGLKQRTDEYDWSTAVFKVKQEVLDNRFFIKARTLFGEPTHSFVSFLIKSLLSCDGLLICHWTLAARIGLDPKKSPDCDKLIAFFDSALYRGVLNEGWRLWWADDAEKILSSWFPPDVSVRDVNAIDRIEIIKTQTKLSGLTAAEPLEYSKSTSFWTHCFGTKRPLDPIDGLVITNQDNVAPWEERKYISIFEALTRKHISAWRDVSATELDRLQKIKARYTRERNK